MANVHSGRSIDASRADLAVAVALALLPIGLTSLAFAAGSVAGVADGIGALGSYGVYTAGSLAGFAIAVAVLGRERLRTLAPVERPSRRQVAAALVATVVGIGAFPVVEVVNDALGVTFDGGGYELGDPFALALIVFGAVVVAPIVEESLFRGVLLGTMLERGWHPVLAGGTTVVLFALMHYFSLGVGGVVYIAVWAVLPTAMRIVYDDLSGAMLLHALNNLWAYVVVVAVL